MTNEAPIRYCPMCGKLEHGSVSCEAASPYPFGAGTGALCRACQGRGGFNQFMTVQGQGTSVEWIHQWIPCALCNGSGVEP